MQYGANLADQLLSKAIDSAVVLDRHLNALLDAYDFYVKRWPAETPAGEIEITDLQASIRELGVLPELIALNLTAWRVGMEPTLSRIGFELNVLNEVMIHMRGLCSFFQRKGMDIDPYDQSIVRQCLNDIRLANNHFGVLKT